MAKTATRKTRVTATPGKAAPARIIIRDLRARYDIAQTNDDNRLHWAQADGLAPDAALTPTIRKIVRDRCRHEVLNNSFAKGIGLTITNDTVGPGPTLQFQLGEGRKEQATYIETLIWEWACEIQLARKLRQMRFARYDSGEIFAQAVNNPGLSSPIKLDLQLVESEQIANPTLGMIDFRDNGGDGIEYDQWGNPTIYRKLKVHPGSMRWNAEPLQAEPIPARFMFHYYRPDRPTQRRGVPEIQPAAGLFFELRRYRAAVVAAAETAAEHAGILKTNTPVDPDAELPEGYTPPATYEVYPLPRRGMSALPDGWDLSQLKAEQPTTTHDQFVATTLKEIARCLCVPYTVAAMDSSVANMSASYVDRQAYGAERMLDRAELEHFLRWFMDLALTEAIRLPEFPQLDAYPYAIFWPSLGHHADPVKVANAGAINLQNGLTSIPRELGKTGDDWEGLQEDAARSLGLTLEQYRQKLCEKMFPTAQLQQAKPTDKETENEDDAKAPQD